MDVGLGNAVLDWRWTSARQFLPFDLDSLATDHGALVRRRGVVGGEALLRTLLLVAVPNASLERASKLACECGFAKMNSTALFHRLRKSERFLQALSLHAFSQAVDAGDRWKGYRVVAVDATVLCGPGAKGTDQRLHTVYDLSSGLPLSVDVTGPEGGETLRRHSSFGRGDLVLGDRGYGYNRSFHHALRSGARILIRFRFETVTLFDPEGNRIWAEEAEAQVPETGALQRHVEMPDWPAPLRAVGSRNPKGEVVWLLTDLSDEELPLEEVRELYRKRWQIELFFKRLKSLLDLGDLPTRDGPTAKAWIWAKLLLAALVVLVGHERFSPWDGPAYESQAEPLEDLRLRSLRNRPTAPRAHSQRQTRKTQKAPETKRQNPQAILALEA